MVGMFSLQHGDELVFQPPSIIQQDQILQDLTTDHTLMDNNSTNTCSGSKGKHKSSILQENTGGTTSYDESTIRKLLHRDNERQRRQEWANLYASLGSRIPSEYRKGKRSISDQVLEAVNYIAGMRNSIEELRLQRDKLKKLPTLRNLSTTEVGSSTSCLPNLVTVNPCLHGVEILINSSIKKEGFPLSKVLKELLGRGFNILNCVSTNSNERSLHRIQCEASDISWDHLLTMKERLTDVINH